MPFRLPISKAREKLTNCERICADNYQNTERITDRTEKYPPKNMPTRAVKEGGKWNECFSRLIMTARISFWGKGAQMQYQ